MCLAAFIPLVPSVSALPSAAASWPLLLAALCGVKFAVAATFTTVFVLLNNSVVAGERGRVVRFHDGLERSPPFAHARCSAERPACSSPCGDRMACP